jgi:plastocyanin
MNAASRALALGARFRKEAASRARLLANHYSDRPGVRRARTDGKDEEMFKNTVGAGVLACAAAVLAAGCHNDSNTVTGPLVATSTPVPGGPTSTPVPGVPTPTRTPAPAPGGQTEMVQIGTGGGMVFIDQKSGTSTTTIHVGDTVQWVWVNGFHSTTSGTCSGACTPDGIWNSGAGSGMTFTHTFTQAGTFPYFCLVHQALMQGMVVVQ